MIPPRGFTSADSRVDLLRTMRRFPTVCTTWLLCAPLLICGCSRDPAPAQGAAAAPSPTRSYHYSGRGAFSRVEQRVAPNGAQQLQSDTLISSGAGASSVRLVESASLDEAGRLVHADICRSVAGVQQVCFRLDQPSGVVRIERTGAEPFEWRVPADAPWVYQGSSREGGELVSTPLAGWIAARAARSSESETVRVLEPGRQRSFVAPIDQVAVATEQGTTVVLGGDGIDLREGFVEEVRLIDRGTTLNLLPPPPDPFS
jgi:hypothetical protein